jgi:Protein of unknown function (DUF2806)
MAKLPTVKIPEGFGRAAEKLADTIRHVVDVAISPNRLRKVAQAQADAEVIRAHGRAEVADIKARAAMRVQTLQARQQENIESIIGKAAEALPPPDQLSDKPVEPDWTTRFFRECEDISDDQMQLIWARILAGEVAKPGSFAPRTLSVVRDLTEDDANLFAKLCEFVWHVPGVRFVPVIHNLEAPHLLEAGLHFETITHLMSIGLIEFQPITSFNISKPMREIAPSYAGTAAQLRSKNGQEQDFDLGHVMFTAVGRELLKISHAQGKEEYRKGTLEGWAQQGWVEAGAADPAQS